MPSITAEELMLFLYQETSKERSVEIQKALDTDWILREKFEVIAAGKKRLEALKMGPRKQTIDSILQYAERSLVAVSDHA